MKAADHAKAYIGEKEKPGNAGFYNPKLQELMTAAGHKKGEAWCCYFAESMFVEAAAEDEEKVKLLRKLFSANCVQTWKNFVKSPNFKTTQVPTAGALVIFQRVKAGIPTTQGHAAIVTDTMVEGNNKIFRTIEGNTNSTGSREGDSVQAKRRSLVPSPNGLNVLGFVLIDE